MSAPYQYAPPPAMPAQRPAGGGFDLDELLGTRPAPPPPPAPPQQQPAYGGYATAQPAPPPPPPNEDPFGFNTQWQQQQQQQQQAPPPPPPQPQQQQPPQQVSYQYGAPAPAPVAYAQPPASPGYAAPPAAQPQPTYAAPPQQQHQQQQQPGYAPTTQQPMSRYDPYYAQQQQQQPPQPVQAPQPAPTPYAYGGQPQAAAVNQAPPQTAAPTAYAYPAAAAAQPQPTAAYVYPASPQQQQQQQAPVASPQQQQPQAEWTPQRQGSAQYAAVMQQPQPQPQPVPVAYGYPGAVAPTPQPAVSYAAVASGYPVPVAPIQPQQPTYNEDQDRANLERIRRLREQLEREQAAEAAAMAARNGGGGAVASVGTTATMGLAAPSDGWQCRTCTFKNALSATACQMCDEARPGYSKPVPAPQQPPSTTVATGQVIRASATNASSGGDWTCQMCQGRNAPMSGICKICNSPRVIESTPVATPSAPANVWACTNCTLHNPNTLMRCQACDYMKPGAPSRTTASVVAPPPPPPPPVQSLPSVPANWNCTTCTFENSVEAPACSMCATPRPSHVTDAINARQRAMAQQQQQASTTNVLPFEASVNGRRLTPEEQERLVRQQAQILEAIQRQQQLGGNTSTNAGRTAPSGARVVAPPQQQDSDDEDPDEPVQWQKDTDAKQCNKCSAAFGVFLRRHHCRSCGFVFCKNCCGNFMTLKTGGKTERVCNDCHKEKTSPAPVVSRPPVAASYPVQQPARDARPAVQAVPRISCDCVAAAEGFHRPGCHNNPSSLASFL